MEPLLPDDPRELGGYRLLRRVGEGGMGVVYLATSTDGTGADLAAVKAVRPEYAGDREFRARFTVEADLARRVRGPYTARVPDADTDGPRPWLATEYVPGPALHDAVRDAGPFPEDSLLALASGLARALAAIHEVGLVHRDLEPSNVLLATRGPQVVDLGIARAADATALTRPGQALGTPAYMAPEQATGSGLHAASDLFSFGGVLVFAATGRAPFGSGEPAALLYRVVNEEPDLSGVPERLLPLVAACLVKDPDERPGLDSVLAELTGTALPAGDDDTTEWLPASVSTTVHHTLVAATRFLPEAVPGGQVGGVAGAEGGESEQGDDNSWLEELSLTRDDERIIGTGNHLSGRFVGVWDRAGELVEEHHTGEYEYSASAAAPSGHGVLLAEYRAGPELGDPTGPQRLRLLDENLENELPTPAPDEESSDRPVRELSGAAPYTMPARAITQSNSSTRPVFSSRVTGYIPVISNPSASYTGTASFIRGMPS